MANLGFKTFFTGEVNIDPRAWHYRFYLYWLQKGGKNKPGYQENLCHYRRVVLFHAPKRWFFQAQTFHGLIQPWLVALLAALYTFVGVWTGIKGPGSSAPDRAIYWGLIVFASLVTLFYAVIIDETIAEVKGRTALDARIASAIGKVARRTWQSALFPVLSVLGWVAWQVLWPIRKALCLIWEKFLAEPTRRLDRWFKQHESAAVLAPFVMAILFLMGLVGFHYPARFGLGVGAFVVLVVVALAVAVYWEHSKERRLAAATTQAPVAVVSQGVFPTAMHERKAIPMPPRRHRMRVMKFFRAFLFVAHKIEGFLDAFSGTVRIVAQWAVATKRSICPFITLPEEQQKKELT